MAKITKEMITELGDKVVELCKKNEYGDTSIYYDGKRVHINYDGTTEIKENCHPGDYFEYYNHNHILSMAFEGILYDLLNYGNGSPSLEKLFEEYGVYYELGNGWNLSVCPIDWDTEVEGYEYEEEPEPIHIYRHREGNPPELQRIMNWWYEASKATGDIGCCVIGARMEFEWNGDKYEMSACSPWQGCGSWEAHTDEVEKMLRKIGATNIYWNCGMID